MKILFSLIRDDVTATSVTLDVLKIDPIRSWFLSSMKVCFDKQSEYTFRAYGKLQDLSSTDRLEQLSGTSFSVLAKQEITGSHIEYDLEQDA